MAVDVKTIERLVSGRAKELVARLAELVEAESPSDDKGAVDRAGQLCVEWAEALGGSVRRHRQERHGDVLELRFGPAKGKRVLVLGHLDTVWPLGTLRHMPFTADDERICGPGVLDMKAGIVMAMEALRTLREMKHERSVTLLLVSDEEVGSPVSRALTEQIAKECDAVFVLEPAQGLAYKTARKGVGNYCLKVTGVGAHAGVDFAQGHSAILEMARLVQKVAAFTDEARGITVNVGVIRGGTRSNVIASECSADVDVRIAKNADAKAVDAMFAALKPRDKGCQLEITGGINRPPMERKPGTVKLFRQAQAIAKELGVKLTEAATGGGSDGNFTAALGVPTLDGMGPVGSGAHAAEEQIDRTKLVERTTLLAAMIAEA